MAGKTLPKPKGSRWRTCTGLCLSTTLKPEDAGFGKVEEILALAVTSHPDFDDTPLWDENNNSNYADDGIIFHSHWVVLVKDDRVPGSLSVKQFNKTDKTVVLPPTNPGMPMYGFSRFPVLLKVTSSVFWFRLNVFNLKQSSSLMELLPICRWIPRKKISPCLGSIKRTALVQGLSLPYSVQPQ